MRSIGAYAQFVLRRRIAFRASSVLAIKQIPASPPIVNCTHPRENEKCVQFFFLHECFSAIIPFEKPKIENPSHLNWINLQRVNMENG